MSSSLNTQQGFPKVTAPIANLDTGGVTQPWYQFFIALWNRTGQQQGGSTFASGDIKPIAYNALPDGWLFCDGAAVSRENFSLLFASIGTTWGAGDGTTTFNVPDLRGRMLIGASLVYPLGQKGGEADTMLTVANLPAHNHAVTDPGHAHAITDPGHHHTIPTGGSGGSNAFDENVNATGTANTGNAATGITVDTAITGITTDDTGSDTTFSTISPYAAVNYIIKT